MMIKVFVAEGDLRNHTELLALQKRRTLPHFLSMKWKKSSSRFELPLAKRDHALLDLICGSGPCF